jgi:hypothetical protein
VKSERAYRDPYSTDFETSTDPHVRASELIELYGQKAQQHAIDLIQAAVRRNDDLAAKYFDRTRSAIEQRLHR